MVIQKTLFEKIRNRKIIQTLVIYSASAWTILQVVDLLTNRFNLPGEVFRIVFVLVICGFPNSILIAWYHGNGDQRSQRIQKIEIILHSIILVVAIIFIVRIIAAPTQVRSSLLAADTKSIAVLPLKNLSDDKVNEFFSDGVTEDIITKLSKIADLKVISHTSIVQYKNSNKGLRDIGKELNIGNVLMGSVRHANNQVRITVQLINTSNEEYLWTETYDKELTQIFTIQSDVAQQIADALKAKLSPAEKAQIEKKPTENLEAYVYYLKSREYYYRYSKQDNEQAIELLKKALELDANYALAYAGLSDAYAQRAWGFKFSATWLDSALVIGNKAISIDPNLAEAYKALGLVYSYQGRIRKALEAARRAVQLNPNYFPAVGNIGRQLVAMGELAEGLTWLKKAASLAPTNAFAYLQIGNVYKDLTDDSNAKKWLMKALELQPDLLPAYRVLALLYMNEGEYKEALEQIQKSLAIDPNDKSNLEVAGNIQLLLNNYAQARQYLERAVASDSSGFGLPHLAYSYWKMGKQKEARKLFRESLDLHKRALENASESHGHPYIISMTLAWQGNNKEACQWLQKAIDAGWRDYRDALIDPLLKNLHHDEKFKQMIAQVKVIVDEMRKNVDELEK